MIDQLGPNNHYNLIQYDYEQIQTNGGDTNYYYCFITPGKAHEVCLRVIDDYTIELADDQYNRSSKQVLTRVGVPPNAKPSNAAKCEPDNGQSVFGGIINIGPDIYVIICGERRSVPNPATLDALGINRNMIDNMELDDVGLTAIPRGR